MRCYWCSYKLPSKPWYIVDNKIVKVCCNPCYGMYRLDWRQALRHESQKFLELPKHTGNYTALVTVDFSKL